MPHAPSGPRTVAIVGPYSSGKSTLFDALIAAAGGPARRGVAPRGATRVAHCSYLDEPWALIDCPGSVELAFEAEAALAVADLALLVCDPDPARAPSVAALLRRLEALDMPTIVFANRIDTYGGHLRDTLAALQGLTRRKLVLREVPIREGEAITGYVDVVSERAYAYKRGAASELIAVPDSLQERRGEARAALVEVLADHDDVLLEKVVEDVQPTPAEVFEVLRQEEAAGHLTEMLIGCAERDHGVRRLWKALRHDAPTAAMSAERRGIGAEGAPVVQVFRTLNAGFGGKLSWARIWRGPVRDGATLVTAEGTEARIGGMWRAPGGEMTKIVEAGSGEIVALGRLEGVATGAVLGAGEEALLDFPAPSQPVYAMAITTADHKDDVRLSGALQKLLEEDPALSLRQDAEMGETVLAGQGEMHLKGALERLAGAFGVKVTGRRPKVPFRETIRHPVHQAGRLKRQTGGHGQFADVKLDIAPRERGLGFQFVDKIVGGAVPRNFIPAVGEAAEEAARKGVFGYPVVDLCVTLVDGGFHSVDSSDMAFRTATRMAMQEALPKAEPVLLEPLHQVTVSVPNSFTATAQRLLSGRRGQILGYGAKPDWEGWDEVEAIVPELELHDFIIELRSQTMGLGSYHHRFDHLAEAHGKVLSEAQRMAEGA